MGPDHDTAPHIPEPVAPRTARTVFSITFLAALVTAAATRALSRGVNSWIRSWTHVDVTSLSDSVSATPAITASSGCSGATTSANVSVSKMKVRAYTAKFPISNTRHPSTSATHASTRRQRDLGRGVDAVVGSVVCALKAAPNLVVPPLHRVPVADSPCEGEGVLIGGTAHWCAMRRAISA